MADALATLQRTFLSGGPVMWPLLLLSVVAVALCAERAIYWWATDGRGRSRWLAAVADRLRAGDAAGARAMTARDDSVYSRVVSGLLDHGPSEHAAVELVEANRRSFERFSATLSTIITVAPLLGILGTVTGIITSFRLLGAGVGAVTEPAAVAAGIAEALITTAFGLIIAMAALFPYSWFRASADRCLGRIEALVAAANQGPSKAPARAPASPKVEHVS